MENRNIYVVTSETTCTCKDLHFRGEPLTTIRQHGSYNLVEKYNVDKYAYCICQKWKQWEHSGIYITTLWPPSSLYYSINWKL